MLVEVGIRGTANCGTGVSRVHPNLWPRSSNVKTPKYVRPHSAPITPTTPVMTRRIIKHPFLVPLSVLCTVAPEDVVVVSAVDPCALLPSVDTGGF